MKKIFFLLLFISCIRVTGKAEEPNYSAKIYLGSPYYLMNKLNYKNSFNYNGSLLFSVNFKPFSFASGICYGTKNYFIAVNDTSQIARANFKLNHICIPTLFNFNLAAVSPSSFLQFTFGLIFNIPRNYHSITEYKNNQEKMKTEFPVLYQTGISTRFGFELTRNINENLKFLTNIYSDFKIRMDYSETHPRSNFKNLTSDRFLMGLNIGLEYIF